MQAHSHKAAKEMEEMHFQKCNFENALPRFFCKLPGYFSKKMSLFLTIFFEKFATKRIEKSCLLFGKLFQCFQNGR